MSVRFVTIAKFADDSGYTAKAIERKIERGDWLEGEVWTRAPDGRVLIDTRGYERWVQKGGGASGGRQQAA